MTEDGIDFDIVMAAIATLCAAARTLDLIWSSEHGNDRWSEELGDNHIGPLLYHCHEIQEIASRVSDWLALEQEREIAALLAGRQAVEPPAVEGEER